MAVKKGLGKGLGLGALLSDANEIGGGVNAAETRGGALSVDINTVEPNAYQPRKVFDDEKLAELAESIRNVGIIQPIVVKSEGDYYSIIAGERRWRAARLAGLREVPVVVRDYGDEAAFEAALIENIQRADLNPVEEADCYRRLIDERGLTQEDAAARVGKNRSHISNALRILQMGDAVKGYIVSGELTMGHARALLPVEDKGEQLKLAERIVKEGRTVRETETMLKKYLENAGKANPKRHERATGKPPEVAAVERDMSRALGAKVEVKGGGTKGKIEITYADKGEFERLYELLRR